MASCDEEDASKNNGELQKLLNNSSSSDTSEYFIKPTRCNGCTFIIEPLLVFNMMFLSPLWVIMPEYMERREWEKLMGNETYPANSKACESGSNSSGDPIKGNLTLAGSTTSYFNLQYTLIGSLPALVMLMFLGPFSDKAGRRYALLAPSIGQMLGTLIYFLVIYFHLPMEIILVGAFVMGCSGNWFAYFVAVMAYITDVTTTENRSFRLVVAEMCMGLPVVLSSAGSGYILDFLGFTWIFCIIFVFSTINVLFVMFLIPETIRRRHHVKFLTLLYIKKAITTFAVDDTTKRRLKLLLLLLTAFLYKCAYNSNTDLLYVMNLPLCWGVVTVGIYSGVTTAVSSLGSGLCSKVLSYLFRDAWVVCLSIVLCATWAGFKYFVVTNAMMFGSTAFNVMGLIILPTARSMMSKLVKPDEIGAVYSGVGVVQVICELSGSGLLNIVYSVTEKAGHPSAVYLLVAGVEMVCLVIMVSYAILTRNDDKENVQVITEVDVKSDQSVQEHA